MIGYAIEDEFENDWNWITEESGEIINGFEEEGLYPEWNPWFAPYLVLDFGI